MDNEEFLEFCRQYGDDLGEEVLLAICEFNSSAEGRYRFANMRKINLDREGANQRISGYLMMRARCWSFEVDSGNWAGTEIRQWERANRAVLRPVPPQGNWMMAPVEAITVRMKLDGMISLMTERHAKLMSAVHKRDSIDE